MGGGGGGTTTEIPLEEKLPKILLFGLELGSQPSWIKVKAVGGQLGMRQALSLAIHLFIGLSFSRLP